MIEALTLPQPVHRNSVTALSLQQTSSDHRLRSPYRKTYNFPGDYIDGYHRWLGTTAPLDPDLHILRIGVDGWLFRADALKLYELAYFNPDVLELGTYKGLSTTIIAQAVFNSGRPGAVYTVDLDPEFTRQAKERMHARQAQGAENVWFASGFAEEFCARQIAAGRRFSFVFIDHSHEYEPMVETCRQLADVTEPGAFCLFHDYNDPRNGDPQVKEYGVYQAVAEHLPKDQFEFWGIFGCTGLFRRKP